jgi:transcriptional regulator with GAF, ATPase, and Fis domain/tetratricopeptide (TPR) repeat protein
MQQLLHVITQKSATGLLFLWTGEFLGDQFERIEHLKLDYLHDEHVKEMVQGMLYMLDPPLWRDQVYQATGGDPRLIVELVHAQIEAGLPDTFDLSEERSCLVEQRLAALSPTERKLLAVVAHTPRPLSLPLLKAVDSDILSALPTLLRKGYLALDFLGSYYPTSLYIRRAAQGFLSGKALIRLHQHFCDVLQAEAHPNRMVLGHHLLWAGDVHQGAKMLLQVAFPLVEDLERATALLPREDELLVEIWRYLAQHTRARGDLPRALAIADTLKHEHSEAAILLRAEILLDTGYPGTALQILDEVVAPTSQHYLLSARAHFLQEHYALSVQAIKASKAADGLDLPSRLQLDHLASLCLIYSGQITEALKALDAAIQSANELDLPDMLARLLNSRGIAFQRLGRWNEAMEAYRLALNVVEKTGELSFAAHYMLNMGMLAHQRMELEDALHYYRKAKQLAARCSIGNIRAAALAGEANLLFLFGALAEAEACLDQAEAVAVKAGAMTQLGHIHLYRAEYWLLLERLEQAESYCRLAGECFSTSNELAQTATDLMASEISLKRQELATGKEILDRLLRRIAWDNPDRWRAHRLLALIALAEQEPQLKEAALELELSHALARRTQNSERIWEIYALLASINQRLGQEEKATFYARCFYLAVDLLRRQIPVAYRTWMGQRKDIQQANVLVESIGNVSPQASPSLKELQRLLDINQNLTRRIPSEVLYKQILDSAIELTEAERGVILLQNQADLEIVAAFSADFDTEGSISDTYNNTIARQAIVEERTIVAANIVDNGQLKTLIDLDQEPLRAAICIPLRIRGKVCGVLYLDHRYQPNIFQQKHLRLAEAFAVQVGIVLESSHLQQEEAEQRQALAEAKAQVEHLNQQLINQVARQSQELQTISERLRTEGDELVRKYREAKIVGQSKAMKELYLKLDRIAEADLPVLIYGESGTGKELIARAIHYTSARQEEPFVAVNCAAIPQALLESELFGHKKGAFTGALRDRPGLFEVAGRGTLFLDEIGEMPLGMQSKLLRVLQEGTFRRIGDEREGTARCRILSATNKNLEDLVADKQFREDLYYRINVFRLELPPLRERREDIPFLIQHILSTVSKKVAVSPAAMTNLLDFDWPGNVRQLENELLRAAFLCEGTIEPTILNLPTSEKIGDRLRSLTLQEAVQEAARDFERQFIQRALEEENFNVSATAKRLGLHRVGLHKKIRALGIHRPKDSI